MMTEMAETRQTGAAKCPIKDIRRATRKQLAQQKKRSVIARIADG